jgi:pSer/pThr/pTyr-binding forkhead associated (FHA) protein
MRLRPAVTFHVVRADGGPEVTVPMRADVLTCGKKGDLALHLDPFVASTQARFAFADKHRLAVEDVGGGNGVFLRVRREHELSGGGELRVGRQRLVVESVVPSAPAPDGTLIWGSPDNDYRFKLVQMLEGGLRGSAWLLKDGDNYLGRNAGEVTFPSDAFVSSRHACLRVQGKRLVARDLGSSNGTFVRLVAPTLVEDGDHFLIGRELFRVQIGRPA